MTPAQILIVEDDPSTLAALIRLARRHGHETLEASSGAEALERIDAHVVDVVVSDISMPGVSGVELLAELAKRALDVPVILMTGRPTLDTAIVAVEHGAFQYVTKPFKPAEFAATIARAVQVRREAKLRRNSMSISGLPGGRAFRLAEVTGSFDSVLDDLWMAYQPIVDARSGSIIAYEALMRTSNELLPHPGAVLDAAEQLDRVAELGRIVRTRATEAFCAAPTEAARLFVNLHPEELFDADLTSPDSALAKIADRVVLEITERAALPGFDKVEARIRELRALGFSIAVDDLGAGYAGLSSVLALSPQYIKLDMNLVRNVDSDPGRQSVIGTLAQLALRLDAQVVAEGVETERERTTLTALGVGLLQGYLLGRPDRLHRAAA